MIIGLGDIQRVVAIDRNGRRVIKIKARIPPKTIDGTALAWATSKRRHRSIRLDLANDVIVPIDDEAATHRIDCNTFRVIKARITTFTVNIAEAAECTSNEFKSRCVACGVEGAWQ